MNACRRFLTILAACAVPIGTAWALPIEEVQVSLTGRDHTIPASLQTRMEASALTVSNRLLKGRDTEEVSQQRGQYEAIASDIMGRVLYGYDIEAVHITPGLTSQVQVQVKPFGQVIRSVETEVDYGNISPYGQALMGPSVERVMPQVEQLLIGAPLDSLDWVSAIAESVLRERLHLLLPYFESQIAIEPGTATKVRIYLIPQGEVVRHVDGTIQSDILPELLFSNTRDRFVKRIRSLQGLPVSFVAQHRRDIEADLAKELRESKGSQKYSIDYTPSLEVGTTTTLRIYATSKAYEVQGQVQIDMGKKEDNVSFLGHVGYHFSPEGELYLETVFYPGTYKWEWYPSVRYTLSERDYVGFQYQLRSHEKRWWIGHRFRDDLYLKIMRNTTTKKNEYSLLYDFKPRLSLQLMNDQDDTWLRLIGHW